ncbi:MAG: GNAT family N-acetyltransferase [Methanobacteriota archaeon]|nr:MAG: GNAT family N-acetyltransferase [Euryarchaeota archaeon]
MARRTDPPGGGRAPGPDGGRLRQRCDREAREWLQSASIHEVGGLTTWRTDRRRQRSVSGSFGPRVTDSLDPAPYAELTDLFVEPDSRRLGVASRLLKYLEGIARERGATHLVVQTGQKNTEAQTFYRSAGYEEYAVAMRKALKGSAP